MVVNPWFRCIRNVCDFRLYRFINPRNNFINCQVCSDYKIQRNMNSHRTRLYSTSSKSGDDWIVLTDDGSTVVCWHPEPKVPYECTKPLPIIEPEMREEDSILKIQYRLDDKYRYDPHYFSTIEHLQKITYTTKHQWFPHPEKKYRKPNPPRDRDGI